MLLELPPPPKKRKAAVFDMNTLVLSCAGNQAFELLNRACMPPGQHNASANNSLLEDSLLDHLSMTDEQTADLAGDRLFDM